MTVVIPTREEAAWIGRALAWTRRHDLDPAEVDVVVVDADSADDTASIAREVADLVVRQSGPHTTIAAARNQGGFLGHGDLLFHTDADVVIPDFAAFLRSVREQFADERVVAVGVKVSPYPWASDRRDRLIHIVANRFFALSFRVGAFFARGECQIVRASTFAAVGGYRPDLVSGEDCDLFRRMSKHGKVVFRADLEVLHSVRRFRQQGYWRTFLIYLREAVWMAFFDRSYVSEWRTFR